LAIVSNHPDDLQIEYHSICYTLLGFGFIFVWAFNHVRFQNFETGFEMEVNRLLQQTSVPLASPRF